MARNKRTGVRPSAYEAKLHATAERQQSAIAGWTRLRVLVAVFGKGVPSGRLPRSPKGWEQKLAHPRNQRADTTEVRPKSPQHEWLQGQPEGQVPG